MLALMLTIPTVASASTAKILENHNYDYKDGFFDNYILNVDFSFSRDSFLESVSNIYDNDLSTYLTVSSNTPLSINFNQPFDIDVMYYKSIASTGTQSNRTVTFNFINGSSKQIVLTGSLDDYFSIDLKGVTSVEILRAPETAGYVRIHQLDFFGTYGNLDITDLTAMQSHDTALLTWTRPLSISSSDKILIYKDGEKFKELGHNISSNMIDGLDPETEYVFRVAIEHQDGTVTEGDTITFTTDEAPDPSTIPPAEISNLDAPIITTDSVKFEWINPLDTNFAGVVIYRNGEKIEDGLLTDNYMDTGLLPNTQYTYKIHTISEEGYMSAGVVQTVTTLTIQDNTPPDAPTGLSVAKGNKSGTVSWQHNTEPDMDGYNVYLNGVKVNTSLIKGSHFVFTNLDNGTDYNIEVTAVDLSGNESDHSVAVVLTPDEQSVPIIEAKYDLKSVADGVGNWFGSLWLILAFAVAIPLTFLISRRIKGLVLG